MGNYMRKIPAKEHAKIVRLYTTMSAREIGERYGVTHQAILNILRASGIKPRPVGVNLTK